MENLSVRNLTIVLAELTGVYLPRAQPAFKQSPTCLYMHLVWKYFLQHQCSPNIEEVVRHAKWTGSSAPSRKRIAPVDCGTAGARRRHPPIQSIVCDEVRPTIPLQLHEISVSRVPHRHFRQALICTCARAGKPKTTKTPVRKNHSHPIG